MRACRSLGRFNRPGLAGNELRYIQESVDSGRISGDGVLTEKCRRRLEELLGTRRLLLTTSCTTALELAALLLDLGPGDKVIMPSFTSARS